MSFVFLVVLRSSLHLSIIGTLINLGFNSIISANLMYWGTESWTERCESLKNHGNISINYSTHISILEASFNNLKITIHELLLAELFSALTMTIKSCTI